jgi:protein SCO1
MQQKKEAGSFPLTALASVIVVTLGITILFSATQGGQSFTTETRRRVQIDQSPQTLSPLWVTDEQGQKNQLSQLFRSQPKVWIVDFVYTRCETLCLASGSYYQQLQERIKQQGLEQSIGLLSISFDPKRDDQAALKRYAERFKLDARVWKIVSLNNPAERAHLLDEFGIMVIPTPLGEFEHNGAFHLVNAQSQLIKIVDYQQLSQLLDIAQSVAQ